MTVRMIDPRRANTPYYIGEASDVKPVPTSPSAGSRFYETDSGIWFVYTGTEWVEMHAPDAGSIPAEPVPTTEMLLEGISLELLRIRRLLETASEVDSDDLDLTP